MISNFPCGQVLPLQVARVLTLGFSSRLCVYLTTGLLLRGLGLLPIAANNLVEKEEISLGCGDCKSLTSLLSLQPLITQIWLGHAWLTTSAACNPFLPEQPGRHTSLNPLSFFPFPILRLLSPSGFLFRFLSASPAASLTRSQTQLSKDERLSEAVSTKPAPSSLCGAVVKCRRAPGTSRPGWLFSRLLALAVWASPGRRVELGCCLGRAFGSLCVDEIKLAAPAPEPEGRPVLVPAGYPGPRGVGRPEAAAQANSDPAPHISTRAADGRTLPGEDFSHRVSLCGLGLSDSQVLGPLQHRGVQVFPLLVLAPCPESLCCEGEAASGRAASVGFAWVPALYGHIHVF